MRVRQASRQIPTFLPSIFSATGAHQYSLGSEKLYKPKGFCRFNQFSTDCVIAREIDPFLRPNFSAVFVLIHPILQLA